MPKNWVSKTVYLLEPINLSDEFNKIDTDELDDLFCKEADGEGDQGSINSKSASEITIPKKAQSVSEKDKTQTMSTVLLKQLLAIKNLEDPSLDKPKLREKEMSYSPVKDTSNLHNPENSVTKNSEKPTKIDQNIPKIIEKAKAKRDEDVDKLEEELLAVAMDEENYHSLLSEINESKDRIRNQKWNDVNSEDLQNVHESFTEDLDLSKDPNIPSI